VALNGRSEQIFPLEEEKIAKNDSTSQLHAMVEYITETAKQYGISPIKGPWLPPLPELVYLNSLLTNSFANNSWPQQQKLLSVPVGIMDDPRKQKQETVEIDFASEGNLFVYGTPGTGKTVFLKTLCISLALMYPPDDVNIYIMDFGGSSLKAMEKLPHVGGVMTLEQEEKIDQFMRFVFRVMEERRTLFEATGSEGFSDYRKSGRKLPALVIMVDNYFALSETYEDFDAQMVLLAREGFKYGIYMVATATNSALVRYKFSVNFKMAVSFQMTEKSEYEGIVGRTEGLEPVKVAGRGLVRGKPPLEFQTSLPEYEHTPTELLLERMEALNLSGAAPIPMMPSTIDLRALNKDTEILAIGLANNDLQPVFVDLLATPVLMVTGEAMSGKSTLLVSWMKLLSDKQDLEVYALDSSAMGIYELMKQPFVTDIANVDDLDDFIDGIKDKLESRRNELFSCRMSGGDVGALMKQWKQMIFVIDRLSEFTSGDMYMLHELIERIVKQERGMKVAVLAADNTSDLTSNWDSLGKTIREEQTGILLGRMKEQNLYNVSLPYGTQEKSGEQGDGYLIVKNKYTGLRCAVLSKDN
jgi:S-DNA-T family DNA segregation ATPase FtsK/SpoIIIE